VTIVSTPTRDAFFAAVEAYGRVRPISELHVFCHSIGGGLAFGYDSRLTNTRREIRQLAIGNWQLAIVNRRVRAGYIEVLNSEIGILFTDDLLRPPYAGMRSALQKHLTPFATAKLWGCNSGVANWIYHDQNVTDQSYNFNSKNPADGYWWRALNTQHAPKNSIAKAMATYFNRPVFGATSGSSIQVKHGSNWISSSTFKKITGHMPGEPQLLQLHPDKGPYLRFLT
jgi:hypothetical protein